MRSLFLSLVLGAASLGLVAVTPSQADAQMFWRWRARPYYGYYYAPYGYWNSYYWGPGYTTSYYSYYPGYSTYYYATPAYYYTPGQYYYGWIP
jgi:hypothetical protein